MSDRQIIASYGFEGLDELVDALEALRCHPVADYPGVEGTFALQGYAVLWADGDVQYVEITDKHSDEIAAADLSA